MRTAISILAAVTAMGTAFASPSPKSFYCELKTTSAIDATSHVTVSRVWQIAPTRFRVEKVMDGHRQITVANGSNVWIWNPVAKTGEHGQQPPKLLDKLAKSVRLVGDDLPAFLKQGAKKTGTRKVNGVLCDVYKRTDSDGMLWTLWVDQSADRLTRKQQVKGVYRGALSMGQKMTVHTINRTTLFTQWRLGISVAENQLSVPRDVKFRESSQPPGAAPFRTEMPRSGTLLNK